NRVSDTVEVEIQGITVRPRLAILDYFLVGAYAVIFTVPGQVTSQSPSLLVRVGGAASQRDVTLPVQAGTGCTYTVSPASAAVSAAGGSSSFTVATGAACAWTAASNQTWLTVTAGASGTGNGTVTLSAGANTGAARSTTATIAGQTVTVSQAAASAVCAYAVDPTGFSVYHLVYQDTFQVVTAAACAWTAVSEAAWLRITGAASGTGPARVAFEVSANPAMTERTGVIRVGTAAFTIRQMGALATFEVDAKSNIFAAGRATAFNGLLPPGYRFSAGAGKVLALDVVNGATHCQSGTATIPADGAAFCVSGSTDVLSYRGIAGVVHGRKVMFLVGVFLDDREPADPAPARLDFTNNEDYTSLAPLLGQVFFLGNGRTAANAQQTVVVPETATRLFLGFADAEAFHGAPGAYQDNTGGLTVSLRVAPGTGGGSGGDGGGTSLTIDARSNIFASGRATAFDGLLPPSVRLAAGTGRSVTVTNATGTVRCASSAANGPDGGTECSANGTDLTSYQGIAGVIHTRKTMFLVGVFLTDAEPADPAPPRLDFSNNEGFATLSPLIGQTFFIGDGQTGTGAGTVQQFVAPDAATRLFLGFADGYSLHGSPGYYGDNSGSLGVTVSGGSGGGGAGCGYVVSPAVLTVAAAGGANSITVATAAACSWTAASNLAWARVTSTASASGPGTVSVTVDANSGAARTATLTIAGQSVTVNQAAGGGGTTCTYTIAPGSASFLAAGGTGRIDVTTQSGCAWTATSTAGWIAFTAGQSGTGSGAVSYTVAANLTASNRLGTISVGGKNHPVEQAGAAPA
ncbi:MAG: BACON domain-containing carbohydrate-binding protein, partial [Candidatus Solibacter sp.]|nr:BACON domain-containing carbohydrate-binding protein [Candidatus Solibacter sp.]